MAKGSEDYLAYTAVTTGAWSVRGITQPPNKASMSFSVTDARRERGLLEIVADHLRRTQKTRTFWFCLSPCSETSPNTGRQESSALPPPHLRPPDQGDSSLWASRLAGQS
uniref:Uncharacterized protein n=1 Tax=Mus musculus TaxID=10090 RepID=Q8BN83_MOUSE|nr:unnamed protein product [Mus musculus]